MQRMWSRKRADCSPGSFRLQAVTPIFSVWLAAPFSKNQGCANDPFHGAAGVGIEIRFRARDSDPPASLLMLSHATPALRLPATVARPPYSS